jgi:penicillin-binding protein 1C
VWVGHPDHRPMHRLTGYGAAELAGKVLERLHPEHGDGLSEIGFPPPADHHPVRLCALSGGRAGGACDRVVAEWLPDGEPDPPPCTAHRLLAVERRSGLLADHYTPRDAVEVRPFVDLPARYAVWQHRAGLPRPAELSPVFALARQSAAGQSAGPATAAWRGAVADRPPRVHVTSPVGGEHLFLDPETPARWSSLGLAAEVDPPVPQVLWRVDGEPFGLAPYPYSLRWPLQPGDHTIQVEIPYSGVRSAPIEVRVE